MEFDLVEGALTPSSRRHLESKATGRLRACLKGPFIQHNYLVHCAEHLRTANPDSGQLERFWRIFPIGGRKSRVGDACAVTVWLCLVIYPIVAMAVGTVCPNSAIIANAVVVCLLMTSQLVMVYVIMKNNKKFRRLWFVSKVNVEQHLGLQNHVKEVSLDNVNNVDLVSAEKRRAILTRLAGKPQGRVVIMIYTLSFWKCHVLDPIISLVLVSALDLAALLVLVEFVRTRAQ